MEIGEILLGNATLIAGCMGALWLLSLALRDASIVDIFWGLGFVAVGVSTFAASGGADSARSGLLVALAITWGLRLAIYLFRRNAGHGEDPRYAAMRRHWGARFAWVSLFTVFVFQGVAMWIVSLPLQLGQVAHGGPLGPLDFAGAALCALGLAFEAIGDHQLARFRADPDNAGRVLDSGLWRYTRHPNYFGDFCVWWGLYAIAVGAPHGVWALPGPLLMSFLLMRVSGVPMLERSIHRRRPEYIDYVRRTSAFFPRPPRAD